MRDWGMYAEEYDFTLVEPVERIYRSKQNLTTTSLGLKYVKV